MNEQVFGTTTPGAIPPVTPTDYVAELAKTRGEQWSDPQVIAKGKLEADQHIETLTNEKRELEEKLWKQDYQEQFLAELKAQGTVAAVEPSVTPKTGNVEDGATALGSREIETLVDERLKSRETDRVRTKNLDEVNSALTKAYGTEASAKVEARAAELGMSKDRLSDIAGESPSAFMELMGKPIHKEPMVVKSSVNSAALDLPNGDVGWSHYQKLRRENPKAYSAASVQNEMVKRRQADPDFFNK